VTGLATCLLAAALAAGRPADGTRAPDPAAPTPLESAALAEVRAAMARASPPRPAAPPPAVSPELTAAARDLARRAAAGEPRPLAAASLRSALSAAGATDPAPAGVLLASRPGDVAHALSLSARLRGATHLGVGIAVVDGTAWAVLLAAERRAELEPFPRQVAAGARAVLRGRLVGLSRPRVYVAAPSGWAREVPVRETGDRFEAELAFEEAGRWRVEVMGEGAGGPTVAALVDTEARPGAAVPHAPPATAAPQAPGAPPPPPPAADAGGRPPAPSDALADPPPASPAPDAAAPPDGSVAGAAPPPPAPGSDEVRVLGAIDARRVRQGLAPLRSDPDLAALARRHSAAMLAAGTVAHVLRGGEDVVGRLRSAGVAFRVASENVARGEDALDAHRAVEESPAHLANLLSPRVRDVGVGVARGALPGGQPVAYLTQILIQPPDDGDWSGLSPEGRAKEAIAAVRARSGLAPLAFEAGLDALARDAAREMLRRGEPDPGDLAGRALARRPAARGQGGTEVAAADAFVAVSPADASRSPNVADARYRRAGVGVARGDSLRFGPGLYWIAVVYTD
jgi:uncharacterized protein YkwD